MTLREWKKKEGARAKEIAAQQANMEKMRERTRHPIVRHGYDRNFRDAYFLGLVYAGYCDGPVVDSRENGELRCVGVSLGMDELSIRECIEYVRMLDNARKIKMWEEILAMLKAVRSVELARLFAAEFVKVRLLNPANEQEVTEDLIEIAEATGFDPSGLLKALKPVVLAHPDDVSMGSVDALSKFIGDECVLYFTCKNISDADEQLRLHRERQLKEDHQYGDSIEDRDDVDRERQLKEDHQYGDSIEDRDDVDEMVEPHEADLGTAETVEENAEYGDAIEDRDEESVDQSVDLSYLEPIPGSIVGWF